MPEVKLKVELISYTKDPEQVCATAIKQCYSKIGVSELKEKIDKKTRKRLIEQIISSGHTSTIEHASFTFAIQGISRACSHQLVRHRIASYSQQSQRYVDFNAKGFDYIIPPLIKKNSIFLKRFQKDMDEIFNKYKTLIKNGITPEDARFILPNACETKIVITMNARAFLNFLKERLCNRAQWEIRAMAFQMFILVKKIAPNIFKNAGPTCQTEKICWQGNLNCGLWKNIKGAELRKK
ncbi:thymidylate synthase (FAD) [Candidatus Kuenenbacteria bacterium HGW-Kuenenbacteria-1]|uniref:Flavin-dependent thymidylate synthase n=1 Tax=Candidatus Kuenenbacteria bacterium HGW-Kuenenbacteria-1 TaxID=2013812 RepID=A0A2N1UNT9_9BACT|nr:MAG: thymidylate synthase (FAD) [Candidatus Kuenenbacteria bacterium HGW-Kuenenbacteria-1]